MRTPMSLRACAPLLLVCSLLSACDVSPEPDARTRQNIEGTRMATTKMGVPFELEGCQVQAWRVTTSNTYPDFTTLTAKCPTADVTTTVASCGKGCLQNTARVDPKAATPRAVLPVEADAERLRVLKAELEATRAKTDELAAQVVELEQRLPRR